jgi:BlaI family penicillinase repressor
VFNLQHISDAEWEVMEVLWRKSPLGASEVIQALSGKRGWKDNTIKTLLARLVQKNALNYTPEGNRYLYQPVHPREIFVQAESESFLNRVFCGSAHPLLLHFASKARLSKQQLTELRNLLEKKR